MVKPHPEGHRPKRATCAACHDCHQATLRHPVETSPWWVTCGGTYALIWAVCANAAGLELLRIMQLRTVGRGWGRALESAAIEKAKWDRTEGRRTTPKPASEAIQDELDRYGITARPATDHDRERWAALVRQSQGLEALEAKD